MACLVSGGACTGEPRDVPATSGTSPPRTTPPSCAAAARWDASRPSPKGPALTRDGQLAAQAGRSPYLAKLAEAGHAVTAVDVGRAPCAVTHTRSAGDLLRQAGRRRLSRIVNFFNPKRDPHRRRCLRRRGLVRRVRPAGNLLLLAAPRHPVAEDRTVHPRRHRRPEGRSVHGDRRAAVTSAPRIDSKSPAGQPTLVRLRTSTDDRPQYRQMRYPSSLHRTKAEAPALEVAAIQFCSCPAPVAALVRPA